ncbi:MAG: ribosome assembly cofactor RimP [Oscillospiraceae bacterium]|nr:ribosome assembly cofactor RimP [Oscillospiraceae bacterium]
MEKNQNIETKARALSEPLISQAGFTLWDVIFEKEGAMNYLRILFHKDSENESVTDEDCALMTTPLNELMDKQDFIKHVDILEIGSPGLTRKLRRPEHFTQNLGKPVRVVKRGEKGKTNAFCGTLCDYEPKTNEFSLQTATEKVVLNVKNCLRINLDL